MRGTELSGLGGEEDTQRKKKPLHLVATTDRSTCHSLSLFAYGLWAFSVVISSWCW